VTTHLNHIYRKLGVSGRVAALSVASQMGIVSSAHTTFFAVPGPPLLAGFA
jgi:hypothetical protein